MLQVLIYILIALVFLFLVSVLGSAMLWVVMRMLRTLFPAKFGVDGKRKKDEA